MDEGISVSGIERALKSALASGMIREVDTAVIFYDLDFLETRIRRLQSAFPAGTLHALAVKANPLVRTMETARNLCAGVEAASLGEVNLALRSGYKPESIVYDSPVKTVPELKFALQAGIHINIDNLSELNRVGSILGDIPSTSVIGLRLNPQVGVGSILESSVAGEYSKFGVPVKSRMAELREAYSTLPWLTGVHLHVGSQGCAMQLLTDGIGVLYDFVTGMNEIRLSSGLPPISTFDIGGGLPVSYHPDRQPPAIEDYVAAIRNRAPGLFPQTLNPSTPQPLTPSPHHPITPSLHHSITAPPHHRTTAPPFRLITEFGRWTYTNCGWTVSRVEYVKHDPGINTAMIHVGADLFLRECLNPRDWSHAYLVFDRDGNLKPGRDSNPWNLAGPLCFSGDILAREITLPAVEEGDYVAIRDSGSYTFSMWSRYNSRQTPRILGYQQDGEQFSILKERESPDDTCKFWE
jgi:diaminopimelate decarboxylase